MPELPEVTTTVNGLNEVLSKLTIKDVWSDYFLRTKNKRKDTIKNKKYFEKFKNEIVGEKFKNAERRGKNVLIHLSGNKTILIHMKMTGHLLYGKYVWENNSWTSKEEFLSDPFNKFVHLIFTLSNGKHLAFSDMRKFAKVIIFETDKRHDVIDLTGLGPEPIPDLSLDLFKNQILKKPAGKIKTVLMDQSIIAGIGNIYSDEILWAANVHPERISSSLNNKELKNMWKATKEILVSSIKMGGDSMSDYRNIYGQKGNFQNSHKAYRRAKENCLKKGCEGIITRKIIGGRSSHFCNIHQK
ncbi:MAG: DNA-formamidopyrimidine glycosylase [Patescibacteria group bacterium]|jgi:formamidopyrimidine-DNA glycosylase|nr:DNA-formamidopyrimidine glycosylase [Patescibacteria group bacterium]